MALNTALFRRGSCPGLLNSRLNSPTGAVPSHHLWHLRAGLAGRVLAAGGSETSRWPLRRWSANGARFTASACLSSTKMGGEY